MCFCRHLTNNTPTLEVCASRGCCRKLSQLICCIVTATAHQTTEDAAVFQQQLALLQDLHVETCNEIVVDDGVDAVRNENDRAPRDLHGGVPLVVDARGALIEKNRVALVEEDPSNSQELHGAGRKIHTHLVHRLIQTVLQALHMPFEMFQAQGFKQFLVTVGPVDVEIAPHGSRKRQGILWNDGRPGANREYRDGLYVHSIHENDAPALLHHPEAREEERGLAASRAAADTQTCPWRDRQRQPLEHQRQVRLVPEFQIPKLERTRCQAT